MVQNVHSLPPHGRGPPSPTTTTTAVTAAKTAPLSSTQYVTNDCGCPSISTADATDAFWFCRVFHHLHASPHATQTCGFPSRPCAFLDVHPGTHCAKCDIASAKKKKTALAARASNTSQIKQVEAQPPSAPSLPLRLRKKKGRDICTATTSLELVPNQQVHRTVPAAFR